MATPTEFVTVRNKSPNDYPLKAADGSVFSVPGTATMEVPSKYTANFDPTIIVVIKGVPLSEGNGGSGGGGSQYPSNVPPYSVVVTQGVANSFEVVTLTEGTVLGRLVGGNIAALPIETLAAAVSGSRVVSPRVILQGGSMTLIDLAPSVPDMTKGIEVYFNGISLQGNHFGIANTFVVATPALNEAYGGVGNDGQGFDADDEVYVTYVPVGP